jgi:hypothetical protein
MQLGGVVGYSRNSQNQSPLNQPANSTNNVNTNWSILPNFGYFVSETSSLGIGIGYSKYSSTAKSTSQSTFIPGQLVSMFTQESVYNQDQFTIRPYYRMHKVIASGFVIFAELNAFYGFGNNDQTINLSIINPGSQSVSNNKFTESINTWGIGLNPGLLFFPSEKWGIDISVGLLGYSEVIGERSNLNSSLNLLTSFSNLSLGLKYYLVK